MTAIELIVYDCYQDMIEPDRAVEMLAQAGFPGFTWDQVADMYMEIECEEEGK